MKRFVFAAGFLFCASPVLADVKVEFFEGAPKDRFVISNVGSCDLENSELKLDLSRSPSGLIFDVTESGQGVEVFQPFELVSGVGSLAQVPTVRDGDNELSLKIIKLARGETISFTIDVDDTIGTRGITVSNSELKGARASFQNGGQMYTSDFGERPVVLIKNNICAG